MSLRKTAEIDTPYATYVGPMGFEWRVLRVNAPAKGLVEYASWFCAVKSDMTYGSFEYGDTYIQDVLDYGTLMSATDDFREYLNK